MKYDEEDLDKVLDLLSPGVDPEEAPAGHLSVQELTTYQEGELSEEEAHKVAEHLAACPECSAQLRELEDFFAPPSTATAPGVASFEAARDWRKLRSRLEADQWFDRGERPRRWRLGASAVAAVLLAVLGLSLYVWLQIPEGRFQTLEPLNSRLGTRSPGGETETAQLPIVLLLRSPLQEPLPSYQAEFRDESGQVVRTVSGLRENDSFEVELPLRRWSLSPGRYEIDLKGRRNRHLESVGLYSLRIVD